MADQGFIYKELVEDVRSKLALRYMSDKRINLKQVVYLLGYSDLAAFNHAFRRWTGLSPSQYRREDLKSGNPENYKTGIPPH